MSNKFLLSIITINYNNIVGLEKTITSVKQQTYKDFEWIIIDGGSTDGSKELLESNQNWFSFWCCEKDSGIYNALNKGLKYSHGDYIQFLNSGDWLYSNDTLEHVVEIMSNHAFEADIYYGDTVLVNNEGKLNPYVFPDELGFFYFQYNNICHQSTFYKKNVFDDNPYDEGFSIVSDWAMNITLSLKGCIFKHIKEFIVYYDNNGKSSVANQEHHNERVAAFNKYVPQQLKIDIVRYYNNYYFSRHRRSTRWVIDKAITFAKWLDNILSKKEKHLN